MTRMSSQSFEHYDEDEHSFAYRIQNINQFQVTVYFPYMHNLLEGETLNRVMDRVYADSVNLIARAKFYSLHKINQAKEADHVFLQYEDDVFDFKVSVYRDKLVLSKTGGKWSTFYKWYKAAVYELRGNVDSLMDLFKEISGRVIMPTRVSFAFQFIMYDIRLQEGGAAVKNSEIMKRVITKTPGPDGVISDVSDDDIEMSRMDYSVSVWHGSAPSKYVVRYGLEAPANNGYSSVWYTFMYGSETYSDPVSGERSMSEPSQLLENYEAVFETMWNSGLNGFAHSLFGETKFETTPSFIP